MEAHVFNLGSRSGKGKGAGRQLRRAGKIPGVVYGLEKSPLDVSVDVHNFLRLLQHDHSENPLLTVNIDGGSEAESVIVRAIQRHPINGKLLHADFQRVDLSKKMTFQVHVRPVGTAVGQRDGGIFETLSQTIEVYCLPTDVPQEIQVDVSQLKIGDLLTAGDIQAPEGVEIREDADFPIFVIHAPKLEVEEAPAEAVVAEPEVIGEKKPKEEEEA